MPLDCMIEVVGDGETLDEIKVVVVDVVESCWQCLMVMAVVGDEKCHWMRVGGG